MSKTKDLHYLELAQNAVLRAGRYLMRRQNLKVLSAKKHDIKLSADLKSEKILIDYLQKRSDLPVLSEENGMTTGRNGSHEDEWVIDPLDGSFNYVRGIPTCCISVGLRRKNVPWLGAIYDFNREELFLGLRGHGAWLNKNKMRASSVKGSRQGVLLTGFPVQSGQDPKEYRDFIKRAKQYKKIRLIGAAAVSLAYVACGRGDAYTENGIMAWDVTAGLAILAAAGGRYTMRPYGNKPDCFTVSASNGKMALPN